MDPLHVSAPLVPTIVAVFDQSQADMSLVSPLSLSGHTHSASSSSIGSAAPSGDIQSKPPPDDIISSSQLIDNSKHCTARLGTLVNSTKFSDITLRVGSRCYHGHRLILANTSDVFEQMLTCSSWIDASRPELVLEEHPNCVEVFEEFLQYIYTGCARLCHSSVLGLLVLADKYNVVNLKEACCQYMSNSLVTVPDESRVIVWYQYSIACNLSTLQTACLHYIILNMDSVTQSADWPCLDKEHLIAVLQLSDMVVRSEYVLLLAVIRWLTDDSRTASINENLRDIIPYIRFPMMLPEHLYELEKSNFHRAHRAVFQSYLLAAYRYHSLSIRGHSDYSGTLLVDGTRCDLHPLTLSQGHSSKSPGTFMQYMYRNYTDEAYSMCVDLIRTGYRTCPRVSSKVEKALSLPISVSNAIQEKQCKLKATFYPQGYYSTSLWNGQLNLAKSSNLTRLTIAHRGGVELQRADISIILYAQRNGVRYVDHALNLTHTFEVYGQMEVENVVDVERLRAEDSAFVIDGAVCVRVFVRPFSFFTTSNGPL